MIRLSLTIFHIGKRNISDIIRRSDTLQGQQSILDVAFICQFLHIQNQVLGKPAKLYHIKDGAP